MATVAVALLSLEDFAPKQGVENVTHVDLFTENFHFQKGVGCLRRTNHVENLLIRFSISNTSLITDHEIVEKESDNLPIQFCRNATSCT